MTDRTAYLRAYNAEHRAERYAWRRAHPEKAREYGQRNRERIRVRDAGRRDEINARRRARYRPDAERTRHDGIRAHGITVAQYEEMVVAQGGRCAVCRRPHERLQIDHDHGCCPKRLSCGNCIRGLLCPDCNNGIGRLGDDPERLRAAADYLTVRYSA